MPTSWADSVAADAASVGAGSGSANNGAIGNASGSSRSAYVPPHLRNRTPSSGPSAPASYASSVSSANDRLGGHVDHPQGGGNLWNDPRHGGIASSGVGRGSGWNNRSGWGVRGREREVNPFEDDDNTEKCLVSKRIQELISMHMKIFWWRQEGKMCPPQLTLLLRLI